MGSYFVSYRVVQCAALMGGVLVGDPEEEGEEENGAEQRDGGEDWFVFPLFFQCEHLKN